MFGLFHSDKWLDRDVNIFTTKSNNKKKGYRKGNRGKGKKKLTNWKPKYKVDEGLVKMIEWIKKDNNIKNYKSDKYNI